jgi:hypothetical protein
MQNLYNSVKDSPIMQNQPKPTVIPSDTASISSDQAGRRTETLVRNASGSMSFGTLLSSATRAMNFKSLSLPLPNTECTIGSFHFLLRIHIDGRNTDKKASHGA